MSYLNCPACHFSIHTDLATPEECPRCLKREDEHVPMFRSPLPYRLLAGPLIERPERMRTPRPITAFGAFGSGQEQRG